MNWTIESHPIDIAETTSDDHQKIYLVTILDETKRPIQSKEAYGQTDRTRVTKQFIAKYNEYITKIEHSEEFKQ
mgnify:FL=1|jgi:hypothetical protein|tara:strand:- start:2099 stop:2320 length:222 start_codon:yes stop_codon:yes gene_type:complete